MRKLLFIPAILVIINAGRPADTYAQALAQPCLPPTAPSGSGGSGMPVFNNNTITGSKAIITKNGMTAVPANYKSFTAPYKNTSEEARQANAGYEHHPEAGLLFPGTPCDNCYELIGKRTETTKTFEKEGTSADGSKEIMVQTSTMPMHYRDANGNWLTIRTQLAPDPVKKGIYAATEQPVPVEVSAASDDQFTSLGVAGEHIVFNHDLELIYVKPDGSTQSLGTARWTNHTAGDDGVMVKDAWPGVDIEMKVFRGAVKTNFIINHPMPQYANGKLLVRDHMQLDRGLSLVATSGGQETDGTLEIKNAAGEQKYVVSDASVYEQKSLKNTLQLLHYVISKNNVLDIVLPGSFLDRPAASYPVIIDPLVTQNTSVTVNGSSYNATWAALSGCLYTNPANTPANCTVTDLQFSFAYTATAPMQYGAYSFYLGSCRSPGTAAGGLSWSCGPPAGVAAGTCTATGGATYSIWGTAATSGLGPCVPAPQCASYPLNVQMYFYQNYLTTPACATTYYYGSQPWIMTVIGHTVEVGGSGGITATPTTICAGSSSTLSITGVYGVPPYTYTWSPSGAPGSPTTVSPTSTTTFTATITDACGITATANTTITVNPAATITGPTTVCVGNTMTLSNGGTAGVWSSATPAVATVVGATGVVTGVSAGTDVIHFTTSSTGGCVSSYTVTVTPLPGTIGGPTNVCVGSTVTATNATAGGTWSSSNTAVATVNPSTGVVSGVAVGTTVLTYTFGGSCYVTGNITVNATAPITGIATVCVGGTTNLSDATPGGTWSSTTASVATVGLTSGTVYGVSPGTDNIIYTSSSGCTQSISVTVNLLAPISGITTLCAGNTTTLTDAAPGGTWSSSNVAVGSIDNTTGEFSGFTGGNTTITYSTPLGCSTTTLITVNALPNISGVTHTNPTTCQGFDGTITLQGLIPGTTYAVYFDFNGITSGPLAITASGIGVLITGLWSGIYSNIYVTDNTTSCTSNIAGPVTLVDPPIPPAPSVTSNNPICIGQTLFLKADDTSPGGTYSWNGPNGFNSTDQNPIITATTFATSGQYTVVYTLQNCINTMTTTISLYPQVVLTNVTPDQSITYGSSVQLNADGALYYIWMPDDGTISNPNINNPLAAPLANTSYVVVGTNLAGCSDTATVNITVVPAKPELVPSAFTPNGDGLNDVFRLKNMTYQKLVEFKVYNRWGQLVYSNDYDPKAGWDGTFNGVPQDVGVYNYKITVITGDGVTHYYKGDVTLIR